MDTYVDKCPTSNETLRTLIKIKRRLIGQILRHECSLRAVLEGRMEERLPRGGTRIIMVDNVKCRKVYKNNETTS